MEHITPPRKFRALIDCKAWLLMGFLGLASLGFAQERLCTLPSPDCPPVLTMPASPGLNPVCSYAHLSDGVDRVTTEVYSPLGGGWVRAGVDVAHIFIPDYSKRNFYVSIDVSEDVGHRKIVSLNAGSQFNPNVFRVVEARSKTTRTTEDNFIVPDEYHYLREISIQYGITCDNGIEYSGEHTWISSNHSCVASPWHDCSSPDGQWHDLSLNSLDEANGTLDNVTIPQGLIIHQWAGRHVGAPRNYGGVNKLAVPVIMIAGLGFDYNAWGVEPAGDVGSPEWLKGEVVDYKQGSLPDMISAAYNLNKGADINNNGIFFINVDPTMDLTDLNNLGILRDRIEGIAQSYVGSFANLTGNFQVDIVCHSTACLAVREFIEAANQLPPDPVFGFHPVNHIRKIVTVNAPHLGTGLGKPANLLLGNVEYGGLATLHSQLDRPRDWKIMDVHFEIDYSDIYLDNIDCSDANSAGDHFNCGALHAMLGTIGQGVDIISEISEFFGTGSIDSKTFPFKGGLFGPHTVGLPLGLEYNVPDDLAATRLAILKNREMAQHNHENWFTTQRLQQGYPRRPDGSYIELIPFYSDRTEGIEVEMVQRIVGNTFDQLCVNSTNPRCLDIQALATSTIRKKAREAVGSRDGIQSTSVTIDPWFDELLGDLRTGWFAHGDVLVERSSQMWGLELGGRDANLHPIPELHPARTYNNHYSDFPEGHSARPVLHAPLSKLLIPQAADIPENLRFAQGGAPLMGMDLFCALDPACAALTAAGRDPIYLGSAIRRPMPVPALAGGITLEEVATQVIDLLGNFAVTPLVSGEITGIAIQNEQGENLAVVGYTPDGGTYVWLQTDAGEVEILLPPEMRPQFQVERTGTQVLARVVAQTGSTTEVPLVQHAPASLRLAVFGSSLESRPARLLGTATPAQVQPPLPPLGSLQVIAQEVGHQEANQSRPRLLVVNHGPAASTPLTMDYYFTADPTRQPRVVVDHPQGIDLQVLHLVGDLWKFTLPVPALAAQSYWPAQGPLQMRLHYADWTYWNTADDYSVGNGVLPLGNEKVVLRDAFGRVLWGRAPDLADYTPRVQSSTEPMALQISFLDGGVHEANLIRPRLVLHNQDGRAMAAGYQLVLALPSLGEQAPLLTRWYDVEFQGSVTQQQNHTFFRWVSQHPLHPGQQISLGEWGIHWPDWGPMDKSGLRQLQLVVLDAQGNVLHGSLEIPPLPQDSTGQPERNLQATFWDGGTWEGNVLRPRIEITHGGGASLESGFVARVCMPWTYPGATPQLTAWYAPQFQGVLSLDADQGLCVRFQSQARLFEGQVLSVGDWGIHHSDWRVLDKSGVEQATLEVFDHQGLRVYP